ncbi:MAG: hypothetical protein JNM56_34340 [Planctomycetia bacterium]|nr:hypothetical protein [Planctomycetia bacterium]
MRRMREAMPALVALLLVAGGGGCYSTNYAKLNKPKREEVYALPAAADARFDKPLEYPKGTLNQDSVVKQKDGANQVPPSMRGGAPGAVPGGPGGSMGGMGGRPGGAGVGGL